MQQKFCIDMGMLARCPLNFFIVLGVLAPNCKKLYKDNFAMVKAKLFATLDPFAKIWPKTSFFQTLQTEEGLSDTFKIYNTHMFGKPRVDGQLS
jgi:hypothetical protein